MKNKIITLLGIALFSVPAFAATIHGSRKNATDKTAGFFIQAYNAAGQVVYKTGRFDQEGKFSIELPSTEPLLYWIDNYPVFVMPDDNLDISLPEKRSGALMIGGGATSVFTTANGPVTDDIRIDGDKAESLLVYDVNKQWTVFASDKTKSNDQQALEAQYSQLSKMISGIKNGVLKNIASFYNKFRLLEAKNRYLRENATAKVDTRFYSSLNELSLNDVAINSLKPIEIRSLALNYYRLAKLKDGVPGDSEDLSDNGSVNRMNFLLKRSDNQRLINEEVGQSIIYHLSIRGWSENVDAAIVTAIAKSTNAEVKANLTTNRDKYRNVSKSAVAPAFAIPDATGKLIKLEDYKGKIVAIDVWATWCIPCMHSLPYFLDLRKKYSENPNIVFISISTDNAGAKAKWLAFLKSKGMVGIDLHAGDQNASAFEKAYNITGIPRYILIDKEGKIIEDHAADASQPEYAQLIETALKSK